MQEMANAAIPGHGEASDVVMSGLSGRLPESDNIEEFAQQLFAGVDMVTDDGRRWTPGRSGLPARSGKLKSLVHFDAAFFGVHAKQAQLMDPQLRLLLEVTHEALVDAGLCPAELRGSRTGVYVGAAGSECEYHWNADADNITGYAATGCTRCMFANRVSYTFDFKGPSMTLDTACASSMFALVQAVDAIRNGHCDAAVVAGTHVCLDPHVALNFQRLKMLSPEGRCAAFDASGRGYVRAEAVVAVLLQRRRDARRVYCAVRGASTNNDGYKTKGITYPAGEMQRRLATETFEKANLQPQDVVYVEAHGTGTKAGDPEELNAVAELYCAGRRAPLLVGSVKSNMGHAEPASGLCAVAKVLLAMERGLLPPNLHYHTPNINIPALRDGRIKVVRENTPWSGGLVALNSFGFGGANAHVVLEGGRGRRPPPAEYPAPRLVLASGRTDEAVRRMLELAASHPRDAELHALIDAVHARAISGHPRRGYAVLDPVMSRDPVMEVLESDSERPIWFVFSGVGSQGPGAGRALMRLPVFAASIAASAAALAAYDVDLRYLVTEAPEAAFDDVINCFVCITAIQVALVDVLRELRVHPDGIVGSSCGEIGCAYADGTLTAEQAVLCAYWRGRSVRDAAMPAGAMAAVGAAWHNARQHCSADIQCACYNTPQDIVISGPCASIEKAVASLSAAGVFARELSPRVAFHSSYCAAAAPALLARLREVIPDPKPRSARWLSTSVPPHHWGSDLDRLSDAAYQVNNLVSPVRLAEALGRVPARALAVELAPHSVLQAALRRALPDAALLPLLRRAAPDPLHHLLAALGKLYAFGAQPQVSRLYPAVPWPVSRGTPSLAPRVRWDHAAEWPVADFDSGRGVAGASAVFQYDLAKPEDAYIAGHCINGRVLFPATGYLAIVWRAVAKLNNLELEKTSVVLENVKFRRATIMEPDAPTRFCVTLPDSGSFEISEGGEVVATGTVRLTGDPTAERLPAAELDEPACETEQLLPLESGDIYKVFRLTRSNYKDVFRGIKSADARFTRGLLQWSDNWIAFMDTMMQFYYLSKDRSGVYLPTRLQRAVIDPVAHRAAVAAASGGAVPIRSSRSVGVMVAGGVELRGVNWSLAMRRVDTASPKLEEYVFIPLVRACVELEARRALAVALQLVVENCRLTTATLKLFERALRRPTAELLLPHAITVLAAEPGVRADAELLAGVDAATYADAVTPLGIKVSNRDTPDGDAGNEWHVALGSDVLARGAPDELRALGGRADFVLLHEAAGALDADAAQHQLDACGLTLVSRVRAASREYVVLRRVPNVPATKILIEVHDDDFTWVDNLKVAMKRAESEELRVVVWSRAPDSGVLGLGTCLRREPGGARLRVYHVPGAPRAFTADAPPYDAQVQRDLAFNVLRSGVWGTYRHLPLEHTETLQPVEHAYVNTLTRGDLSSLRWVESDMPLAPHRARAGAGAAAALCRVHCAPLNFRDVMLATGKLPPDALPGHLADQECVLGLEFSGLSSTGKRVMGMVPAKGLATTVLADESFTWEVPTQWSLEEAATVPVAYATAYYALVVRGRMQRGESVLVHAGAGGVGQAAIAVALHAGCTVYTTVGSPAKRAFLRDRFPQLLDASIGNSRDCSFEQLVLRGTRGRGVDLVLNSLAGDKLQASVRCLAEGGRFLEIGKVDLSADSALGMAVLLKNTTVHGILLDALQGPRGDGAGKAELGKCMAEGITAGVVRPLPATIFAYNQLEEAFRYMSTGKHIGKVVIRVREEQPANERLLVPAVPRVYMHPGMSYVLVGGLGGFGLELCDWLVSRGARTVVLSSRSGVRTGYQSWCIRRWRSAGVVVLVSRAEAATAAGARALLREAAAAAPVGGVFHLAAVLRDALLENQTPDTFRAVAEPKINVARELDAASRELAPELKYFVVFSSVACGRGNVGQSNYGLANSGMERLVERRRAAGLPALAVQWGAVGDVGLAADTFGEDAKEVGGTAPQRIASCLETLERLLLAPRAAAVLASMVLADRRARDKSTQDLVHAVANILGIKDLNKVSSTATLVELGLDSLMVFEVKQLLERSYDTVLDVQAVRALTVGGLRDLAGAGPSAGVGPSAAAAATAAPTADAEIMPRQVLVKLPSLLPANSDQKLIFMVHPIEGVAEQLRGVAAHVRGAVLALQCTRAAPLADMAALASFYVEQVRSAQPEPPYTLAGYSFGASVAFEMALQLERGGCAARLVLLDGSPAYVADAIASALDKRLHTVQLDDVHLLAHSGRILFGLDLTKVASELEPLSSETARLSRLREMAAAVGVRVGMDELRDAVQTLLRRVIIAHEYRPAARLRGPVTLFRAQESEHDYGLEAACAGELRTRTLPATHRTIVTGSAARAVADHLSELLARH